MQRKNFIRRKEDFVCGNCGERVKGSGYTNHCPSCLFSKHVDNLPGDRSNRCGGLMQPVAVVLKSGLPHKIIHRCMKCGDVNNNIVSEQDNREVLLKLKYE